MNVFISCVSAEFGGYPSAVLKLARLAALGELPTVAVPVKAVRE